MPFFEDPKKLILAFQMRTGSNLLASKLLRFGLNQGLEFFQEPIEKSLDFWCEKYGIVPNTRADYLKQLIASASQQNVFVCKLAWNQKNALGQFLSEGNTGGGHWTGDPGSILERTLYKDACWVFVSRNDKVAQAVSLWKAFKTNCWTSLDKSRSDVNLSYDFQCIFKCYSLMIAEEHLWNKWFNDRKINPLRVNYEDINTDLSDVLQKILANLDLDAAIQSEGVTDEPMKLTSQTDSINTVYIDWFREDLHRHSNRIDWNSVDAPWRRQLRTIVEESR